MPVGQLNVMGCRQQIGTIGGESLIIALSIHQVGKAPLHITNKFSCGISFKHSIVGRLCVSR